MKTNFGKDWTLFLDRDGVINEELIGSYVTSWEEFEFCPGALDALQHLTNMFGTNIVVTNQRGVGKKIMSLDELKHIHHNMIKAVEDAGGHINKVYSATALHDSDHNRKPNTGMGMQAKEDFKDIDFTKSVMVGNSPSDLEFGRRLGMYNVFITSKYAIDNIPADLYDEAYHTLYEWSSILESSSLPLGMN